LRSSRIIAAVFASLLVGLVVTAAIGLALVGALNLISVAFAVLFIGLGVDFGIQFSVRYRAERHEVDDLHQSLINTARYVGAPLTLAATATAAGFLSFLPTDYQGLSELGLLAGLGMIVALLTSITFIPALLTVLRPPGEPAELGYKSLAPVDRFMERRRIPILAGTGLVVLAGLPLLYWLQFDFNPLNLRNPKVESVATFLDLRSDPALGASSIYVLAPNQEAARADVARLEQLPEVAGLKLIDSLIPDDQQPKLAAIHQLANTLGPALRDAGKKLPTERGRAERRRHRPAPGSRDPKRFWRDRGQAARRCYQQSLRRRRSATRSRARGDDSPPPGRARSVARLFGGAAGHA
jgi:predicted exporter